MPDVSVPDDAAGLRAANARLRELLADRDADIGGLRLESGRERSKDRKRGGQPGHPGKGLARDPDPGGKREAPPPAECRKCKASLDGAAPAGTALEGKPWLPPLPGLT